MLHLSPLSPWRHVLVVILLVVVLPGAGDRARVASLPPPPAQASLHAIPLSDGTGMLISAGGPGLASIDSPIFATLQVGPTSYGPSHTPYDPATGAYMTIFEGVAVPGTSSLMTATITTTLGMTGTLFLGRSIFERRYLAGDTTVIAYSHDGKVRLVVPAQAVPPATYLVVMNTVAPPDNPPFGYRLLGQAYAIRASGAQTQTLAPLLLSIAYDASGLADVDAHTLSVFLWNAYRRQWQDVGGTPAINETGLETSIRHYGTYAIMSGATWRDVFNDYLGLSTRTNLRLVFGGRLALRSDATSGNAVSVPISPTVRFAKWGSLHYTAAITNGTTLSVDVLAEDGTTLRSNVANGASLAALDPAIYPRLRLRVTMHSQHAGVTPYLDDWQVTWAPQLPPRRMYLPAVRGGVGPLSFGQPTPQPVS